MIYESYQKEKMSKYVNTNSNEHHSGSYQKELLFDKLQEEKVIESG